METHYFLFTPNLSHAYSGTYRHCMDLAKKLTEDDLGLAAKATNQSV